MRLYLDTCCLMRPFDELSIPRIALEAQAVVQILEAINGDDHELVVSETHKFENDANPHAVRRAFAEGIFGLAAVFVPNTDAIEHRASLWQKVGVKSKDASHLASAEEAAVEVFATCDDNLVKRSRRRTSSMRIVSISELHRELFP
jgi:hypothetical protein